MQKIIIIIVKMIIIIIINDLNSNNKTFSNVSHLLIVYIYTYVITITCKGGDPFLMTPQSAGNGPEGQ